MIRIRLTRKLAAVLNGVDVSGLSVGDVLELPDAAAHMMIAERWAELATDKDHHSPARSETYSNWSHRLNVKRVRVRLIKKLAPVLNGFDVSKFKVGDVILVPEAIAAMLIREGWAERVKNGQDVADKWGVKVRIMRQPTGAVEGISLQSYRLGQVYDIAPSIAEYLVAEGFALVELREEEPKHEGFTSTLRRRFSDVINKHRNGKKITGD